MTDKLLVSFEQILGSENIDTNADSLILRPPTETLLAETIKKASIDNIKLTVRGAGTYPVPVAPPESVVVMTSALAAIPELHPGDFLLRAQSGATVGSIVDAARAEGFHVPVDARFSARATVGGAFMAGAYGLSAYRYRSFRDSVIGLRCVTAAGEIVTAGGRTAKNVTGYDLTRFFAGTMGLYGVATELTLKISPSSKSMKAISATFDPGADYNETIKRIVADASIPSYFELLVPRGLGKAIALTATVEGLPSGTAKAADSLASLFDETGGEDIMTFDNPGGNEPTASFGISSGPGYCMFSVPPSSTHVFLEKLVTIDGTRPLLVHPLEGKVHLLSDNRNLIDSLGNYSLAMGGKLPVVWNRLKRKGASHLFSDKELAIARKLKLELDPGNVLNSQLFGE